MKDSPSGGLVWFSLGLLTLLYAAVLVRWPDNFFADDSYFYFQVASNFAQGLGSTFNGLMPTNGYHPLWMLVCAAVFKLVPGKYVALHAIGVVIALLDAIALVTVTILLRRAGTALPFVVWLLYLPFCFTSQLGTEGALSGAFVAATLFAAYRFALRPGTATSILYVLLAAFAVLSRLDNIFIITALWIAQVAFVPREQRRRTIQLLLSALPLALLLWAAYVFSNHHWFGTLQPISGMLKAHSKGEHKLFSNLPHTALFDLVVIGMGLLLTHRYRNDRFHRVIELPMAAGVLAHALYIVFIMSSETRWSWYYTTWTLLAGILLARTVSIPFDARPRLRPVLLAACTLLLLCFWFVGSYRRFGGTDPKAQDPGFQTNAVERAGLHTLLAFDKPGRIAYYSSAAIVPLDGLMGDLRFQQDLASSGVASFDTMNHVDGFIGPPLPLDAGGKRQFCDVVYLSSVQFHCVPAGPDRWGVDSVTVYARLTGIQAGSIPLPPSSMVWNSKDYVAVWRVDPAHAASLSAR